MTKTEKLLQEIKDKWGEPTIDYLGPSDWRVWVYSCHYHETYGTSSFCAHGNSLLEAINRLIKLSKTKKVIKDMPNCNKNCPEYFYDGY